MPENESRSLSRRSLLGALTAGAGAAFVATSCAALPSAPASASPADIPPDPVALSGDVEGYRTRLLLLGTAAGPRHVAGRSGICSVVSVDGHNYLVDAGTGAVKRVAQAEISVDKLSGIFITHNHSDHLADLFNLFLLNNPGSALGQYVGPVPIFGPGPAGGLPAPFANRQIPILDQADPAPGLKTLLEEQMRAYRYDINIRNVEESPSAIDYTTLFDVREVVIPADSGASFIDTAPRMAPFPVFEDERVRVTATLVPHFPVFPSFGFRFDTADGSVTFSGDTGMSDNLIELATGTDILVHEVIDVDYYATTVKSPSLDAFMRASHTTGEDVGRVATAAGAKKVVLSHIGPGDPRTISDDQWAQRVATTYSGPIVVGNDLTQMGVGSRV
ncbi:MBL fold metallo-hydrolase [Rhodococcus sp. ACT016]|uniref:MBL fold metallo-hydrolase n=1 Tax=Rhodococcus sp. ACT016 TaxID=3134808 RepID=UPI003D2D0429